MPASLYPRHAFAPRLALALAALLAAPAACGADIGRLFFTPERRAQLDRQRELNVRETKVIEGTSLTFDGVVRRSDGATTVWINGLPQPPEADAAGLRVRLDGTQPGRAQLQAEGEPAAELRVGQSLNRSTKERADLLGGGTVRVRPAPGARQAP